jgi:hypothetical protein
LSMGILISPIPLVRERWAGGAARRATTIQRHAGKARLRDRYGPQRSKAGWTSRCRTAFLGSGVRKGRPGLGASPPPTQAQWVRAVRKQRKSCGVRADDGKGALGCPVAAVDELPGGFEERVGAFEQLAVGDPAPVVPPELLDRVRRSGHPRHQCSPGAHDCMRHLRLRLRRMRAGLGSRSALPADRGGPPPAR